jgi:predicted alpha/beta hydrolase family esterase
MKTLRDIADEQTGYVKHRNSESVKNESWDFLRIIEDKWRKWKEYMVAHSLSSDAVFTAYKDATTLPAEGAFYILFERIDRIQREKGILERELEHYKSRYLAISEQLLK